MAAMSDEQPPPRTGTGGHSGGAPTTRRAPRRRGRLLPRLLLVTGLLLLAFGALTFWQAWTAYGHLTSAADRAAELRAELVDGTGELEESAARLSQDAERARAALDGPNWSLLTSLPVLGDDVDAVRRVTVALDELASGALTEIVAARRLVDSEGLRVDGGRVDLSALDAVEPRLTAARASVRSASQAVDGIDPRGLLVELRLPFLHLRDQVAALDGLTGRAVAATRLLPPMLGADEPREYLLLVQNNAEPRALGGIPGALITLRADDGRLKLGGQRPAFSFPEPVLPLSRPEVELYGTQLGRYVQNVTATPDFPRAARLAREMWQLETGRRVDGVVAIDPVLLEMLLDVTGPVALPDNPLVRQVELAEGRSLTGDNASRVLLNQIYIDIEDPELQNRFFTVAAAAVFRQLTGGGVDLLAAADVFGAPEARGRALIWSAQRREQATLSSLGVSGRLSGERDGVPVVGVYLHDRSTSKIGYYQDLDVDLRMQRCDVNGVTRHLRAVVTMDAQTPDGVEDLPAYVSGAGGNVPAGVSRPTLLLYAPEGAVIADVHRPGGRSFPVASLYHEGLHVASRTILLQPRQRVRVVYTLRLKRPVGTVDTRVTPGPDRDRFAVRVTGCGETP